MSEAAREMTLAELVDTLPPIHRARDEYAALLNARPVEQPGEKRACMRMDGTHEPWCTAATPPAPGEGEKREAAAAQCQRKAKKLRRMASKEPNKRMANGWLRSAERYAYAAAALRRGEVTEPLMTPPPAHMTHNEKAAWQSGWVAAADDWRAALKAACGKGE